MRLDCQEAFENGETNPNSTYFIRPTAGGKIVRTKCVFDGIQGWTVVQRRVDGSVRFEQAYDHQFINGFGNISSEYYLGTNVLTILV